MEYRAIFSPKSEKDDDRIQHDISALDSEDAFKQAYHWIKSQNKDHLYSDITIMEIPQVASPIGIRFSYTDTLCKKDCCQYMIIKAESEEQAKKYYYDNFYGKRFYQPWPCKVDDKGNCIYGKVKETYYAACPGFHFDATK